MKTCVSSKKTWYGDATVGEIVLSKKQKIYNQSSGMILDFLNTYILADSQISSNIKRLLIQNGWKLQVTSKNVPHRQKHTHIR